MSAGITITLDNAETKGYRRFDLQEVLALLGDDLSLLRWRCHYVECLGERAADLHALSDDDHIVDGQELVRIASHVFQVIDGKFEGYRPGEMTPRLIIQAVRSSMFDILSCDDALITKLRKLFPEATFYTAEDLRSHFYFDCE